MPSRLTFSNRNVDIQEYAFHHNDVEKSLRLYFSAEATSFGVRFTSYTLAEVSDELGERLSELDMTSALTVLTAVEAAFRIDYLQRCYCKKKDPISRAFRELHKQKQATVSLENEIFDVWKTHTTGSARIIGDLRGAFKFRHWLAHGRYWVPQLGQKYDYVTIYTLATTVLNNFPLCCP